MKILQNWRIIIITLLFIWCIVLIHPFTRAGVQVSAAENPSSLLLRSNDFVYSINNQKITAYSSFEEMAKNIEENDTLKIVIERETFPYSYMKITHQYITNTDDNPLSFYAKPSAFSKIEFNAQLKDSNKFTIKAQNPDEAIKILSKRFKTARIPDYIFEKQENVVVLYTTSGKEISKLIETEGKFEAKIGNQILFTEQDIESYCISGVDCLVNTYPIINQDQETTEVVWLYGFETRINAEAASRFPGLINDLSILKCEYDRCTLNETIDFYLDGEKVGFETVYASDKERNLSKTFVGGEARTKIDALKNLYLLQAILQGRTEAKIVSVEPAPALLGENILTISFSAIALIILINAILLLVQFKDLRTAAVAAVLGIAEIVITLGILSGLKIPFSLLSMIALVTVSVITLAYQNYSIRWIKKEGLILKKISNLNSKHNMWMWIAAALAIVTTMFNAELGAPFVVYFITTIIFTKGLFFKAIRAKKQ